MLKPVKADPRFPDLVSAGQGSTLTRVWDPVVRLFHWGLVASFITAWFTARTADDWHYVAGYVAAGLIVVRLAWGLGGTRYARFRQFLRHPGTIGGYLNDIIHGRERRYIGHNPAGGAMVLTLMLCMVVAAFSGWMMTTDTYFGVDWVENTHSLVVHGMVLLIAVHVGGVLLASVRHGENLVRAMITGTKRAPDGDDVA